jgi:recombination protein RecT
MKMADVAIADPRPPMVILRERLQAREGELRAALTDITPEQFIRAVMTSAAINPDILGCSWNSVWLACMKACRDGLLPDGVDGAIVAYGKNNPNAQWIPMYQGLLRRFRRSGQFKWVKADVVRQGEEFYHYVDENGEHFRHTPGDSFNTPIKKVYALATTKDGGIFVQVMPIEEIEKVRKMSRASRDDSPWRAWPEEMMKKTVLRRLCKYLPSARDLIPDDDDAPDVELPPPLTPTSAISGGRPFGPNETLKSPTDISPSSTPIDTPGMDERGGEQDVAESVTDESVTTFGADVDSTDEPAAADAAVRENLGPSASGLLVEAYERGKRDKSRGAQRKAVPPDYREPTRTREALSWQAGWDGTSMPVFHE